MTFGDTTDKAEALRIVDSAFDAGRQFHRYGRRLRQRVSEGIVARRSRRTASAGSSPPRSATQSAGRRTTAACRGAGCCAACDGSLARLATDYIDIYYLHRDDRGTPIAETVGAIGDLIRSGKIRYFGVSNYRGWRIAEVVAECAAQGVPPPVVCQPYYNLLNRMPRGRDPSGLRPLRHRRRVRTRRSRAAC